MTGLDGLPFHVTLPVYCAFSVMLVTGAVTPCMAAMSITVGLATVPFVCGNTAVITPELALLLTNIAPATVVSAELLEKFTRQLLVSASTLFYSVDEISTDNSLLGKIDQIIEKECGKTFNFLVFFKGDCHHIMQNANLRPIYIKEQ